MHMKAILTQPDRLILREIPWKAGALLGGITALIWLWGWALANAGQLKGGLIIIGIGVIFFLGCFGVFVKLHKVTLDRKLDQVEITEIGIYGRSTKTHPASEFHGATLQSMIIKRKVGTLAEEGRKGCKLVPEPRVWRAALTRRNADAVPLSQAYGSEKSAQAAAAAINAWYGKPT
jgi:hypothetical protein